MMWGTWLFWMLIGGLILLMFRRGGCCGHTGHGGSQGHDGGHAGSITPGNVGKESDTNRKQAHVGCH